MEFRKQRNLVSRLVKESRSDYLNNVIGASLQENPKKFWSYVRSCKSETIGIPPLRYGNNLFSSDKSKAEALNSYFFSVFTQEKQPIPTKPTSPYNLISDIDISTHGVYKQLLQLNPRKACGPDEYFVTRNTYRTEPNETNTNLTPTTTVTIPYIKGTSEIIARILQPYNIRVAHRSITTLRKLLTNVKDKDQPRDRQGAVYKIKCCDCQATYIGETGRNLNTRLTEHRRATRNGDINNNIAEHHLQTNHRIDWDSATCVTYNTNYYQRIVLESWFTNLEQTPINRCLQLPAPYKRLIDDINRQTTD